MYDPDKEYHAMLERLRIICKQKNVSRYALAKKTGISTSGIGYLLSGKTMPYIYTLLLICNALDISIGDLFNTAGQCYTEEELRLIQLYRSLPPEKRKLLDLYTEVLTQTQYDGV